MANTRRRVTTIDPFAELEEVAAKELQSTEVDVEFKSGSEVADTTTKPLTGILTFRGEKSGLFRYAFTAGADRHFIVYSNEALQNLRLTNHKFRVSTSQKDGKTRQYYWYQ